MSAVKWETEHICKNKRSDMVKGMHLINVGLIWAMI